MVRLNIKENDTMKLLDALIKAEEQGYKFILDSIGDIHTMTLQNYVENLTKCNTNDPDVAYEIEMYSDDKYVLDGYRIYVPNNSVKQFVSYRYLHILT